MVTALDQAASILGNKWGAFPGSEETLDLGTMTGARWQTVFSLCICEDHTFDPQNPHKSQTGIMATFNPSTQETGSELC